MYLYQATKDPYYLEVGRDILESIERHTKTPCGYATVSKFGYIPGELEEVPKKRLLKSLETAPKSLLSVPVFSSHVFLCDYVMN